MSRIQYVIRWRVNSLKEKWYNFLFSIRSRFFLLWFRDILGIVKGGEGISVRQKVRIIGPGTIHVGKNVRFGYQCSPSWRMREIVIITKFAESTLKIEDFCTVNNNNSFVVVGEIKLCESTKTGHDCQFFDSDMHSIHPVYRHTKGDAAGRRKEKSMFLANVMIGAQVTVGPGTTIGENSVVGIRSTTRWKDYPANFVISGNPARAVMKIEDLLIGQD